MDNKSDLKQKLNEALKENKKLKNYIKQIKKESHIDDLTNLPNKKFLKNYKENFTISDIKNIIGNKNLNNNPFSILFCDIDGLKMVNDTIGHETANIGIKKIATIINSCIRNKENNKRNTDEMFIWNQNNKIYNNIAIRIGGDEFLIFLFNCSKEQAEKKVVKRIIEMIDSSEYKRRQSPIGIKISEKAFGKDRRMPITNNFTA